MLEDLTKRRCLNHACASSHFCAFTTAATIIEYALTFMLNGQAAEERRFSYMFPVFVHAHDVHVVVEVFSSLTPISDEFRT